MKTILVPLDGSAAGEYILPYVRRLAPLFGARVHLLVVITTEQTNRVIARYAATPSREGGPYETEWHWERRAWQELTRAAEVYLMEHIQALRAGGLEATYEVAGGAPAACIVESAAREPEALIAMTTHGYSGLQRWSLGSVADKVIHAATTPVFLVRTTSPVPEDPAGLKRLLVPSDGSPFAAQALPLAVEFGVRAQAELILLHAVPLDVEPSPDTLRERIGLQLAAAVERLHLPDIPITQVLAVGDPAEAIVDQAVQRHADLIVMATHGYSGLRRWALGSVADKLLHACAIPLLLVRPQPGQEALGEGDSQ
jgi:nucleotide-binding universal stress UspA family protein